MPRVTPQQLVQILLKHPSKGAKQATLVTCTKPKLLKKGRESKQPCPWPLGIERIAVRSVTLGAIYANAVNRQRVREFTPGRSGRPRREAPDYFRAQPLWNGHGERDTPYTRRHKQTGRIYLAIKPAQAAANTPAGSVALVREEQWRDVATGRILDYAADRLAEYLPAERKSKVQKVRQDVQWRTIALDSIIELRYGDCYQIEHTAA